MNKIQILFFALVCLGPLADGQEPRWQNGYDEALLFICPTRQSISNIKSVHDNHREDRMWDFQCKDTFDSNPDCYWSGYVNDFDQQFSFQCSSGYVISGMSSHHDNKREDRRWNFYCCKLSNYCNSNCQWTTYVNGFDEAFDWTVPSLNYLVGAESYHDNHHEDRRWKYLYCTRNFC